MRAIRSTTLLLCALTLTTAVGCGSKSSRNYAASTVAPSTSGTPAPTTSTTTPGTQPPQTPTLLTEATVSSWQLKEVIQVDAKAGTAGSRWATGEGPTEVVNAGTMTYVANAISQDVTVIDRLANATAGTIDVTATPVTGSSLLNFMDPILSKLVRPTGLAANLAGTKLYSANLLNVTVIDAATLTPTKSMLGMNSLDLAALIADPVAALTAFGQKPVKGLGMAKVATTPTHAFVTCMITGNVMKIDALTDRVVDYYPVGRGPVGIAATNDKVYVASAISQEVHVLDANTGATLQVLSAGMIPVDVTVSPSGDKVYVANALSGDITVIDTAADLVVDTLPAGRSITSIFQQLGITLPTGTGQSGIMAALNGFLQGFAGGLNNPASLGSLVTGGTGSLLSPATLINGLLSGFLAYAGVTQQQMAGINLPGIGIMSVTVAEDPTLVCAGNAFMGELAVTETTTRNVSPISGLTGLGPVDVQAIYTP